MEYFYQCQQACMTILCCGQAGISRDTPEEQCGLLEQDSFNPSASSNHLLDYNGTGANGMGAHSAEDYQAIQANKAMEQETLRRIVERTAENLIDVTGSGMERLPQADFAERTDEYQGAVGQMRELDDASQKLLALPQGSSAIVNPLVLFNASTPVIKPAQLAKMQQWSEQVEQAIKNIHVDHTGEMVVSLTWTITE
ncbi:hypothetical protein BDF22DRAFT_260460 [Syncephalis plumigaleata]|nr:hypothetical protein BDF22DRAFT_260460 [Syncephalis plumigaleata]